MPNLSAGVGTTDNISSDKKQVEHHMCLSEILREFQEVCHSGGFKTRLGNRDVVLKFFIMFVIGDTKGLNDLCIHMQQNSGCSHCLCPVRRQSIINSSECIPRTMRHVVQARGDIVAPSEIRQRYRVPNAFWLLPFADRLLHIFCGTPKEALHV